MDSLESFEAVIAADAVAQAVSGTNEQIVEVSAITQNFPHLVEAGTTTSTVTVDATTVPAPSFFEAAFESVENKVEEVVDSVESEVVQIEQAVVAEVEEAVAFVETEAKEGYVAAENLVRKVLNHHIAAGGGSIIKNPG